MSTNGGGISFDLSFDGSKMMSQINSFGENIKSKFSQSFSEAGKNAEKSMESSNEQIKSILNDSTRSAKSKASAIAAIYRKSGLSMSEAMKKAWEQIERDSGKSTKKVKKDISSVSAFSKKIGATLLAAFSITRLVQFGKECLQFGKECLQVGSDLQEVQNVVDVTFPNMTSKIDKFAKDAAASFGLSETMAKKYSSTLGSMAKSFGFTESQAYDMGTTLAGLAGDVASFYNLTQDEAYTKLKSVFTGETESLKDLGVVMTQSALDAFALANGFGKTTKAMSEAEKVALRYQFVQDKLSAAQGDFARTSDSWANQTRILSLQFESLKATIGQGLINLFTPVIKVINTIIGKLSTLANAFKSFTELITGKNGKTDTSGISGIAGAAEEASESVSGIGDAAANTEKKMKALMGFDEIQKIDGSSNGSTAGTAGGETVDFGTLSEGETVVDKVDKSMSSLVEKMKELATMVQAGFSIGFGDSEKNIAQIKTSIDSIGTTIKEIFTSEDVLGAAGTWADSVALNIGKASGAVSNVAVAIVTNLTSGIATSIDEKKEYIKEKISTLFVINSEMWNISGNLADSLGKIISDSLTSDSAINISSDICSILTTGVLGGAELFAQAGLDLTSYIAQPIIDNKDKISSAITNTLQPISTIVETIKTTVEDAFTIMKATYDQHIAPMISALKTGISDTFGKLLDVYNESVAPALQNVADKFEEIYEPHIKPVLEKIGELIGIVADAVKELYLTWVKPFVDWLIQTVVPVLAPVFETLGTGVVTAFGYMADAVGGAIDVFKGCITFLTGVFTGNWKKAWEGIQTIFSGIVNIIKGLWEGIKTVFSAVIEAIKEVFSPLVGWFKEKYTAIQEVFANVKEWFGNKFTSALNGVKTAFKPITSWFKEKYKSIKEVFANVKEWFGNKFTSALNGVKTAFKPITSWFKEKYKSIKDVFANVKTWFSEKFTAAYNAVKKPFENIGNFFGGIYDKIKEKLKAIGSTAGEAVGSSFKNVINGVLKTVEDTINKAIGFINGAIKVINKLPGVNVGTVKEVALPRLAQGGFVKKNTPQLAVIGDNRHQGEVVAPEDKLSEMAMNAVRMASGNDYSIEILKILKEILEVLKELDLNIVIDGKKLKDIIVEKINQHTVQTGVCEIII